jgi:hypothetical protein
VRRISTSGGTLVVRLRFRWRNFPYALTVPATAPRRIPGPFRVVRGSARRVVLRRGKLTLEFERLSPSAAELAFRRGRVDEAPVALGDIRAALAARVSGDVRVRELLALDLAGFDARAGPLAGLPQLRGVYWATAPRFDYQALVDEYESKRAYGLLPGNALAARGSAAAGRAAGRLVAKLPAVAVPLAVDRGDPPLVYGARILSARWREVGLGPVVRPTGGFAAKLAAGRLDAWFTRLTASYPRPEALLGAVLLARDGRNPWRGVDSPARDLLVRALGAKSEGGLLARADAGLQDTAALVPVAWVADARQVSPRLRGWYEDALGNVDYTRVRAG